MFDLVDNRTLYLTGFLIAGAFGPLLFAMMRSGKTYAGFRDWAMAEFAYAGLFLLQVQRSHIDNRYVAVVGNLLFCAAMLLLARGMRLFCGENATPWFGYCFSAAYLAAAFYFYFVHDDPRVRTLLTSPYLVVMSAYASLPLLRNASQPMARGYRPTAAIMLVSAGVGALRFFTVLRASTFSSFFDQSHANTLYCLSDLVFILGVTFSFFMLTNTRNLAELSEAKLALEREVEERERTEQALRAEMSERKALAEQLSELSVTDELTGSLNRRGLINALRVEIQRAQRTGAPLAYLILDLDRFKRINDTHGHAAGDAVLIAFAGACRSQLRVLDVFGRLGGEEFAVLLPGTEARGAQVAAEKLRAAVEALMIAVGEQTMRLTTSVGVSLWSGTDSSGDQLMAEADRALYRAKESGRNCVCVALEQEEPRR
jgi:diguanylate cyclase (GGDEF)-like protein